MKQNPFKTASTAIDPMPLPTSLRRDDIPVEACKAQSRNDMLSGACKNHIKSKSQPPMSFQQRNMRERESMGSGLKK